VPDHTHGDAQPSPPAQRYVRNTKHFQDEILGKVLQYGATQNFGLLVGVSVKLAWILKTRLEKLGDKDAFNELVALEEVSKTALGDSARAHVCYTLADATQTARRRCTKDATPWTGEQMQALMPAIDLVADGIISGKFGVNEAIYACGYAFNGEDPKGSLAAVEEMHAIGLEGIAAKKAAQAPQDRRAANANECDACGHHGKGSPEADAATKTNYAFALQSEGPAHVNMH
jgi:hypothetical protein